MSVMEKDPGIYMPGVLPIARTYCCRLLRPTAMTTIIVALSNAITLSVQAAIDAITLIIKAPVYPITPIVQPAVDAITFTIEAV